MFDLSVGTLILEFVIDTPSEGCLLEKDAYPFILLTEGRHYQILLARIISNTGLTVSYVPLKIQKNCYTISVEPESRETNLTIAASWEQEIQRLSTVLGFDNHTAYHSVWNILQSKWQQPLPPLTFCKKRKVFFHPLCMECFSPLTDCKDDILLAKKGLPTYSTSTTRFIYCPSCAQTAQNSCTLYAFLPSEAEQNRGVRSCDDLFNDFSKFLTQKKHLNAGESMGRLEECFPCLGCEDVENCYPETQPADTPYQAGTNLFPLTFYDSYILPLGIFHLRYDDFCRILSGLPFEDLGIPQGSLSHLPRQYCNMKFLTEQQQPLRPFFFGDDDRGLHALEIFKLKMTLFHQLCKGIREIHARCSQPHLDIRPAHIGIQLGTVRPLVPQRWSFDTQLLNVGTPLPFEPDSHEKEFFSGIYYPPITYERIYTHPLMYNRNFGHQERANFILQKITEDAQAGQKKQYILEGLCESPITHTDGLSEKDIIHLLIPHEQVLLDFWCKKIDQEGQKVFIRSKKTSIREHDLSKLKSLIGFSIPVQFSVYPSYTIPCDLYSLGMILFVTLLQNDAVDAYSISQFIDLVSSQLTQYSRNHPLASEQELIHYLHDVLASEENGRMSSRDNVFLNPTQREQTSNAIPLHLWYSAFTIGFKLCTHIPHFSFCQDHGDFDPEIPEAKLDSLLAMVCELATHIDTELFSSYKQDSEILEALSEWRQESRENEVKECES